MPPDRCHDHFGSDSDLTASKRHFRSTPINGHHHGYQRGKLGVFELMDVKEFAARILGRKTDIMTRDSLHKTLRQAIEATAVRVF
jgi:hypothetical protein